MTIASETSRVDRVGDGVNDTFTFTFEIYVKTDLLVYVDGTRQTVDIHYTVPDAAIENPDGGTIVFGAEYIPALDAVVSIILNLPYTQLIDYVEADKFPAETHERGLDRLIKIAQQLRERSLRQPSLLESSQYSDLSLPDPTANKLLAWKDDLSGLKNVEIQSEGDLLLTDFIKTLIDDEDAAAALITLGLTATKEEINSALDGITATASEINTACDGIIATAAEINKAADGIVYAPITGDATAGRVLRRSYVYITNATADTEIKGQVGSIWNGDTIALTDNIGKGETVGNFTLNAGGNTLTIEAAGLAGNCIALISYELYDNGSGTDLLINGTVATNDITLMFMNRASAAQDLTTLVDIGSINVYVTYLTDA